MPEREHPDAEFTMQFDNRPDGKVVPFLRDTYYMDGVARERDFDALTGRPYEVRGQVTDHDPSGTVAERMDEFATVCRVVAEAPRTKRRWWERHPSVKEEHRWRQDLVLDAAENLGLR